jgi:hypothetical protein
MRAAARVFAAALAIQINPHRKQLRPKKATPLPHSLSLLRTCDDELRKAKFENCKNATCPEIRTDINLPLTTVHSMLVFPSLPTPTPISSTEAGKLSVNV